MNLSSEDLRRIAGEAGFSPEPLEKVVRLLDLLDALRSHPYLANRMVLKGGTALNLFVLDLPRLSVDIDFNYVGSADREIMLAERPTVEAAIAAVCARQALSVARVPEEHAGGKWRLGYQRADGRPGRIELDLNYLHRVPLWPCARRDSRAVGPFRATGVPMLDEHELLAGKLAALFGRAASRDLFDTHLLLGSCSFDTERLRIAVVVYGAMSVRDWRTVSLDEVSIDVADAERRLLPMLRTTRVPDRGDLAMWCDRLVRECRDRLSIVLPLRQNEIDFVAAVRDRGEILPQLVTADPELRQRLHSHPALQWRAQQRR